MFWCYGYKQQVSTYVNIKTNKKDNEFHIQNSLHGWHWAQYKISYKLTQMVYFHLNVRCMHSINDSWHQDTDLKGNFRAFLMHMFALEFYCICAPNPKYHEGISSLNLMQHNLCAKLSCRTLFFVNLMHLASKLTKWGVSCGWGRQG